MRKILIIGHSVAGVKLIDRLRAVNAEAEITLIAVEADTPYCISDLSSRFLSNRKGTSRYSLPKGFYEENKVQVCSGQKVIKISTKRKYVVLEDKQKYFYDFLVLADLGLEKVLDIKGNNKEGIYNIRRLADMKAVQKNLNFADTIIVQESGVQGLRTVADLSSSQKEIIYVAQGERILEQEVDRKTSEELLAALETGSIRVIFKEKIVEVLGDLDARAVRLSSGKVLAAQMILLGQFDPDLRLLKDAGLDISVGIRTNAWHETDAAGVFAIDRLKLENMKSFRCDDDRYQQVLEQQGEILAGVMIKQLSSGSFSVDQIPQEECACLARAASHQGTDFNFVFLGEINDQYQSIVESQPETCFYEKLFIGEGKLVGAVLINCLEDEKQRIEKLLGQHVSAREDIADALPLEGQKQSEKLGSSDDIPSQSALPAGEEGHCQDCSMDPGAGDGDRDAGLMQGRRN